MFDELEVRRAELERHRENAARLAQEYHKVSSTGYGYFQFEDCLEFDVTFIEEPYMSYGAAVDLDEIATLLDLDQDDPVPFPATSGIVTEWDQDDRGYYTGAWVGVNVYFPMGMGHEDVEVLHHFTFTAIGMKDIPPEVKD